MSPRSGSMIVIVAGIAAILATFALAFLQRMRADAEEGAALTREIQARVMLQAGLTYIAETSRIGWDREAYGWIDVRDGSAGPKDERGQRLGAANAFPAIGYAARCPMFRKTRPPWAIKPEVTPNPVALDVNQPWSELISYAVLDPQPVVPVNDPDFANLFATGDPRPVAVAAPPSWFRVYRSGKATFIITAGCGPSRGFATWTEVEDAGETDVFGTRERFAEACRDEYRAWYEAEWTPSVMTNGWWHYHGGPAYHLNALGAPNMGGTDKPNSRAFAGHFLYIGRLPQAPAGW